MKGNNEVSERINGEHINDDVREALFIVEWYASSLNDSLRRDDGREKAFADVMELLNASKLPQGARAAVLRVVLTVLRCSCDARRSAEETNAREASRKRGVVVKSAVAAISLIVAFVAIASHIPQTATFAFGCFVAIACPELASWIANEKARLTKAR